MGKVLIVDDDKQFCKFMKTQVMQLGYDVVLAHDIEQGFAGLESNQIDLVLLDVNLPDGSGLEMLPAIKKKTAAPEVIIITGEGDPDGAELAINNGAWDYIEKTCNFKKMILPLTRALKHNAEKKTQLPSRKFDRGGIIGNSIPLQASIEFLELAAESDSNVIITGETGTGKELFARTIHNNSSRAQNRFVVVDCAAMPETLVESFLFGHVKGAFTSADTDQPGLVKQAHNGTLFLDEIGEIPMAVQKAFLRVLQERSFRPVGGKEELYSNFRLIAATHRNLEKMVEKGQFRQDLLYRVRTLNTQIPPLRERLEDIPDLTADYLDKLWHRYKIQSKIVSEEFIDLLKGYHWTGNIRELLHILETAVAASKKSTELLPIHLPTELRVYSARRAISKPIVDLQPDLSKETDDFSDFRQCMDVAEKVYLQRLIKRTNADLKKACLISGISRARFYVLLKKHGLSLRNE